MMDPSLTCTAEPAAPSLQLASRLWEVGSWMSLDAQHGFYICAVTHQQHFWWANTNWWVTANAQQPCKCLDRAFGAEASGQTFIVAECKCIQY